MGLGGWYLPVFIRFSSLRPVAFIPRFTGWRKSKTFFNAEISDYVHPIHAGPYLWIKSGKCFVHSTQDVLPYFSILCRCNAFRFFPTCYAFFSNFYLGLIYSTLPSSVLLLGYLLKCFSIIFELKYVGQANIHIFF